MESRLLQREVTIILEGVTYQNFIGTVLHPNGNIAEVLLKEGLARCVDWNLSSAHVEAYRSAERLAKEKRLRLWMNYQPPEPTANEFTQNRGPNAITPGKVFNGMVRFIFCGI